MGLIDIPPYVLTHRRPPSARGELRAFHRPTFFVPTPIDFPRELFTAVLDEHARLVERHGADILGTPLAAEREGDEDQYLDLDEIHLVCALLVSDGVAHEIHKWRAQEVSYVVQRCRGIVRRLMESPPDERMYLVVVAGGVASLQLVRGCAPRRVGDPPRLEVVERDLVVEPWEQWHQREPGAVVTWWRTPAGELAASRVEWVRPRTVGQVIDALLAIYDASLHQRLAAWSLERPRARRLAIVSTDPAGDSLRVDDQGSIETWLPDFPGIVQSVRRGVPGFDAVVVDGYHWAELHWWSRDRSDVGAPGPLFEQRVTPPDDDEPEPGESLGSADVAEAASVVAVASVPRRVVWLSVVTCCAGAAVTLEGIQAFRECLWTEQPSAWPYMVSASFVAAGLLFLAWEVRGWLRWRAAVHEALAGAEAAARQATEERRAKEATGKRRLWMGKLSERLARLGRLVDLGAPETVADFERKLVRKAIVELEASDVGAVLRAWPREARLLDPHASRTTERAGDQPN